MIGGTSAGAAVMSRRMIAGGTSFEALLQPPAEKYESIEDQDSGRLFLADGLGFLPTGIVDQHFDRKARLGRLVRALGLTGETLGYGVDENTAIVVDLDSSGRMLVYTFSETNHSQAWWLRHPGGARYSIARVRLDIHRRGWREAP